MSVKSKSNSNFSGIKELLDTLITKGVPAEAVDIYKGRNRVVKYTMPSGELVNIKAFRIPHIINRFAYGVIRASKAERAYYNAIKILELGFFTPAPLGFTEERNGIMLGRSFFVSKQVEGFQESRNLHNFEDKAKFLESMAKLMYDLHKKKVWMKDYSQGNVLWRKNNEGNYEFMLVDINRMQFNVTDKRKLMCNFSSICDYEEDLRELARYYALHAGKPVDEITAYAFEAHEKWLRKQRMKQKLR